MPTLDVPGGTLNYEVAGDGPPLVLIHAGIADLRMWDEDVPAFSERHTVIRYDTRGFGRTTTEAVPYSDRQDLRDLLDHLAAQRAPIVGLSRAGAIATDFALESPERVSALVLVAAGVSGFEFPDPEIDPLDQEMERLAEAREFDLLIEMELSMWVDGPNQSADRVDPSVRERVREMLRVAYAPDRVEGVRMRLDPPAVGRLSEISAPTLVIVGDLDVRYSMAAADKLAAEIPGARKVVIPGVAHMVNMERPREFQRLVLEFLAEVGTA